MNHFEKLSFCSGGNLRTLILKKICERLLLVVNWRYKRCSEDVPDVSGRLMVIRYTFLPRGIALSTFNIGLSHSAIKVTKNLTAQNSYFMEHLRMTASDSQFHEVCSWCWFTLQVNGSLLNMFWFCYVYSRLIKFKVTEFGVSIYHVFIISFQ